MEPTRKTDGLRNFLCAWLICQLVLIGAVCADIHWQMDNGQLDCHQKVRGLRAVQWIGGALVPLVFFVSEDERLRNYCVGK